MVERTLLVSTRAQSFIGKVSRANALCEAKVEDPHYARVETSA